MAARRTLRHVERRPDRRIEAATGDQREGAMAPPGFGDQFDTGKWWN
jgi:hypothetical protein